MLRIEEKKQLHKIKGRNVDKSSGILKNASDKLINVPVHLNSNSTQFNNQKWSTYFRARQRLDKRIKN